MLTHQETADLERFVDAVKQAMPGYRASEQQRQMIAAVADTFDRCLHGSATAETDGCNVLVCESGMA
jgi:Rad3-related DNA helicase